eukprot:804695_1
MAVAPDSVHDGVDEGTATSSVYRRISGQDMFEQAQVVQMADEKYLISIKGKNEWVDAKEMLPVPNLGHEGVADMVHLEHLNEASILFNLRQRFRKNRIYTYTGAILISVNPYQNLGIYSKPLMRLYSGQTLGSLPPHIYAVADCAYREMMSEGQDQSVLISGESGAGKTEAAKKILEFVAHAAARPQHARTVVSAPHDRILATQPILEAFGNAKTVRNDNSSRFGKLLDLQFDHAGYLVGASIQNYLLEQSRVVSQGPGERNYHSFYFMLEGADKSERDLWQISNCKDFAYTKGGSSDLPDINSKVEYTQLKQAMSVAGLSANEVHMCFAMLAAI